MFSIRTILCPVDFSLESRSAIRYAKEFAAGMGAFVLLLHVVDMPEDVETLATMEAIERDVEMCIKKRMDMLIDELSVEGIKVEQSIDIGDPLQVILQKASEIDANLIIMGTGGKKGLKRLIMGSVTEHVARGADCPVLVVKHNGKGFVVDDDKPCY